MSEYMKRFGELAKNHENLMKDLEFIKKKGVAEPNTINKLIETNNIFSELISILYKIITEEHLL